MKLRLAHRIRTFAEKGQASWQDFHQRFLHRLWQMWEEFQLKRKYPTRGLDETLGNYGERIAAVYLQRKGYFILERSFRIKSGEIDLIAAWQRRVVVFVEVKTWANQSENTGGPSDAVDETKQTKITKTALTYMKRHRLLNSSGRADVIEIFLDGPPRHPKIRHFENAFDAVGLFQMFS